MSVASTRRSRRFDRSSRTSVSEKVCKEAGADLNHQKRPAPFPGPRCTTCHRKRKKEVKLRTAEKRVEKVYGITGEEYDAIYELQGGRCFGCQRATGKTKRLSVDHNHSCPTGHSPALACRVCVRGLLCGPCNRFLGIIGDNPEVLERFAGYLRNPPAQQIL